MVQGRKGKRGEKEKGRKREREKGWVRLDWEL